jgi:hypothetical protein
VGAKKVSIALCESQDIDKNSQATRRAVMQFLVAATAVTLAMRVAAHFAGADAQRLGPVCMQRRPDDDAFFTDETVDAQRRQSMLGSRRDLPQPGQHHNAVAMYAGDSGLHDQSVAPRRRRHALDSRVRVATERVTVDAREDMNS